MSLGVHRASKTAAVMTGKGDDQQNGNGGADPPASDPRRDLEGFVQKSILPRLRSRHAAVPSSDPGENDRARVTRLLDAMRDNDEPALCLLLSQECQRGTPHSLFHDLICPATDVIGEMWADDRMQFWDVTLQVGLLQRTVRDVLCPHEAVPGCEARLLMTTLPDEQHVFGAEAAALRLSALGVETVFRPALAPAAALDETRRLRAGALGLGVRAERHLPALVTYLAEVRAIAGDDLPIVLGGPLADLPRVRTLAERHEVLLVHDDRDLEAVAHRLQAIDPLHFQD